jgi:hypothetical protein
MKILLLLLLATILANCQTGAVVGGNSTLTGPVNVSINAILPPAGPGQPTLNQTWVNSHESDAPYAATKYIGNAAGTCTANTGNVCNYVCTDFSCLTQVITDHCAVPSQKWLAIVHAGTLFTDNGPLVLQACSTKQTAALVFNSDSPLAAGKIPCVSGIQDNIAGATDIYTRNQGCTSGTDLTHMWSMTYTLFNNNGGNTNGILAQTPDGAGNGPSWYVFKNLQLYPSVGGNRVSRPIQIDTGATTPAMVASHIGFDQVYVHGDATDASGAGANWIADYWQLNCATCWITNSNADGGIWPGTESHGIVITQSTGPIKIVHNVIEGQSIGIFTGGILNPQMPTLPAMQDLEERRNRLTYPAAWLGHSAGGGKCGVSCVRKNGLEHKGSVREVLDGNIIENVDGSGGQNGILMNYNVRACSAGIACEDYNNTITDVTQSDNVLRHGCYGIGWDGGSGASSAGISVALPMRRVLFQNNLIYDVSMTNPGCISNFFPLGLDVGAARHAWPGVTVTRNAGGTQATVQLYQGAIVNISAISISANVVSVTTAAMPQAMIGGSTFVKIVGVTPSGYNGTFLVCTTPTTGCAAPTTTSFTYQLTASLASGSTGTAQSFLGEVQSGITTGDPVYVSSCVDNTFNAGPNPPVSSISTVPSGSTVTYANVGTGNASTTCTFTNGVGAPFNLTLNHNTFEGDLLALAPDNGVVPAGAAYSQGFTLINNLLNGGGWKASSGNEGTASINGWFDTTSLISHHNVFADRLVLGNWTANTAYRLGDRINPASGVARTYVAVTSGTSGAVQPTFNNGANSCATDNTVTWQNVNGQFAGASSYTQYNVVNVPIVPPTTLYFTTSSYCYTASATAACTGFVGGLSAPTTGTNTCTSGTQVPASGIQPIFNLATWTQYALDSSSSFHNAASDSTDMGADMTKINAAQTATQYVCKTYCGTGSYPD